MDFRNSNCHLQCRSCSKVIEKSNSYDDLGAIACRNCGTLQSKEETIFEALPHFVGLSRSGGVQNSPTVKKFIAKISNLTNTLNLPHHVTEKAILLAQRMSQDDVLKRQKCGPKMAACIYYVTRSNGYAIPLKSLSIAAQTPMGSISKCLKLCIKKLQLEPLPYLDYVSFLERFSESFEHPIQRRVIEWSKEVENIVKIAKDGTSSAVAALALMKVVLEERNTPFNFEKVCSNFSINHQNLRLIASKVRRRLLSFSEKIPWKPSTLVENNVASFLPHILKYHKQFMHGTNLQQLDSDASYFEESVKLVIEIRSENRKLDTRRQNDPVFHVIWKLLDKGCSEEEILSQNLSTLSQRYLDHTNDSNSFDYEIPDEEIEQLLK